MLDSRLPVELVASPAGSRPRLKRLRFLLILFAVLLLGLISFVFGIFMAVASDLPSLTKFSQLKEAQSSVLLDDVGRPIGVISEQNRVIVQDLRHARSRVGDVDGYIRFSHSRHQICPHPVAGPAPL